MEAESGSAPIDGSTPGPDTSREWGLTPRIRARAVAVAEILLCSSVPTQVLIGAALALWGWSPFDGDQLSLRFVVTLSIADTLLLIALMVLLTRAHGESVKALWIGDRPVAREAIVGLLLVPAVFLMVVVLLNVLRIAAPWLHNVPTNPLEQLAATPGQAALFALVAILAGGVREELQRAFLLRRFERHLGGVTTGIIVLSVAFGMGHVVQGWDAVITTGTLGAFWAVLYVRRRSVIAPMVSHAGFNTIEVVRVAIVGV
jgi:membrane protease YdiL (CAAX protease family)